MTLCPKCGLKMAEGTAYCNNPACGAVPGQNQAPVTRQSRDFVLLARLAAIVIAGLAFSYLFFGVKAPK